MSTKQTETTETALDLLAKPAMSHETAVSIFTSAVANPENISADSIRECLETLALSMADLRNDRALHLELIGIDRELADANTAHEVAAAARQEQNDLCKPLLEKYQEAATIFRQREIAERAAEAKASRIANRRSDVVQKLARNFNPPEAVQGSGRMSFPKIASA